MGGAIGTLSARRFLSRNNVEEYRAAAPPQQIIIDPNLSSSMLALNVQHTEHAFKASPNIEHLSVGGVKALGAAIAVRKSSLAMEPIENEQFLISFEYTSTGPATVTFLFHQLHKGLKDGIPLFSKPHVTLGPVNLPVGDKVKYKMEPSLLKGHPSLTMSSCAFQEKRSFVPILIMFKSIDANYVLYVMAGLAQNECNGSWDFIVTKQRVKQGDTGYQIQEIYGLNVSAVSKESTGDNVKTEEEDDDDDRKRRCVVCLTNRNDTFIMPCRHMCLCFTCANTITTQYNHCPMCRRPISQIISMSQAEQ